MTKKEDEKIEIYEDMFKYNFMYYGGIDGLVLTLIIIISGIIENESRNLTIFIIFTFIMLLFGVMVSSKKRKSGAT